MFISTVTNEVSALLKSGERISVILTIHGNSGKIAVALRGLVGNDANVVYLSGYVFASLNQTEVDMVLADFPEVKCISLNRKATEA